MKRVHHKPRSQALGCVVGWALCVAGAIIGLLLLCSGFVDNPEGSKAQAQIIMMMGAGILIFFVAGLPKGSRSDTSAKPPHTK